MTATCSTCKHWTPLFVDRDRGFCESIGTGFRGQTYEGQALIDMSEVDDIADMGGPTLQTHRDFGCTLHAPEETP